MGRGRRESGVSNSIRNEESFDERARRIFRIIGPQMPHPSKSVGRRGSVLLHAEWAACNNERSILAATRQIGYCWMAPEGAPSVKNSYSYHGERRPCKALIYNQDVYRILLH